MINYTDGIARLMADLVARVEPLSFIRPQELLVFARSGRSGASGAYATCHSMNLPTSQPGYYYWRDRETGRMTRRSEWFVTRSPEVVVSGTKVQYLLSFMLPRFCDQTLENAGKQWRYGRAEPWVAKLDTIVHELYHISPADPGLRRVERADGGPSSRSHSADFFDTVEACVRQYLESGPDPMTYEFLKYDFSGLVARYGQVVGTSFRTYPSYPQRYMEALEVQPSGPDVRVVPMPPCRQPRIYSDADLLLREFTLQSSRRFVGGPGRRRAA